MGQLIDGKHVASELRAGVRKEASHLLSTTGKKPKLTVVILGENPASQSYVRSKKKSASDVGFDSDVIERPSTTTELELLALIEKLNKDEEVHGILVQLPLPDHINEQAVIRAISVDKDVDGFHPEQVGGLSIGLDVLEPCTPSGIMALLDFYNLDVAGKNTVVIGRSNIVGKPIAQMLLKKDATVTIAHSRTKHLAEITRQADFIIVAIGRPKFLTADMVKEGVVVVDVGINRTEEGKLVGDVDFSEVEKKASYITPVPGGVGPMTITMLLSNTLKAFKKSLDK